jgi:hypothetical protein
MGLFSNIFRKRKDNNEIDKDKVISFEPGFALTELPVISLYQGDQSFNFLLDTGSNDSIIDSNVLDRIEHVMTEKQNKLYGMEGNVKNVKVCNITLSYKDNDYPYDYNVQDMSVAFGNIKAETGVTLHGIIGSKFFNTYKYVLDFESLIAYSKK